MLSYPPLCCSNNVHPGRNCFEAGTSHWPLPQIKLLIKSTGVLAKGVATFHTFVPPTEVAARMQIRNTRNLHLSLSHCGLQRITSCSEVSIRRLLHCDYWHLFVSKLCPTVASWLSLMESSICKILRYFLDIKITLNFYLLKVFLFSKLAHFLCCCLLYTNTTEWIIKFLPIAWVWLQSERKIKETLGGRIYLGPH